jgi:hypothetical protein
MSRTNNRRSSKLALVQSQRWARVIVEAFPWLDGVRYTSRSGGHPCAALYLPAAAAMPDRPAISLPLTHPGLVSRLAGAAQRLGHAVSEAHRRSSTALPAPWRPRICGNMQGLPGRIQSVVATPAW